VPGNIDPHLQIANLLYFSVNNFERSVAQLRKCLHSDPDSKPCSKAFRRIKNLGKSVAEARALKERRQFNSAAKLLVGVGGEAGIIDKVKEDMVEIKKLGYYPPPCPEELLLELQEMACEAYTEVTLTLNPTY
jgi:DnaJ family protein C protein 3